MTNEYASSAYTLEDYLLLFQNTNVQLNGNDSRINFMEHNYTISDITECKSYLRETMNKKAGSNVLKNTEFLNKGEKLLTQNLMQTSKSSSMGNSNTVSSVYVTPVKKDNRINILEKETYDNIINIDTQYISSNQDPRAGKSTNDFSVKLTEPINNVCELTLNTIQLPYTFYNISDARQNDTFVLYMLMPSSTRKVSIVLESGHYDNIASLLNEINEKLSIHDFLEDSIEFVQNNNNKTISIVNRSEYTVKIEFYRYEEKTPNTLGLYRCLGWVLGCRQLITENEFDDIYDYNFVKLSVTINANSNEKMQGMPCIPDQKYFVLCIDDFTKSQNDKNIISTSQTPLKMQPKIYPMDEKNMNCIDCSNAEEFNGKYTKAEQYSQIEILKSKRMNSTQTYNEYLNVNNVLAIIPFHQINSGAKFSSIMSFDSSYFIKRNRKYFGPVELTKLKFSLYDDYGNMVDFNECDWNFSLIAKSLYKN